MLYNIKEDKWDEDLLELINIPENIIPKIVDSSSVSANLDKEILGVEVPISGIAGDHQAALFGQLCINKGEIKNNYRSVSFCIMNNLL